MSVAAVVSVLVTLLSAAVSLGVLVVAIRRTRREPRRLSNGFWLLAGSLLALEVAAGVGVPGAGLLQGLLALLIIGAPVLIDVVAVFLIINGVIMLRRERRSPANALSLLAGLALLALSLSPFVLLLGAPVWLIAALLFVGLAAAYVGFVFVGFLLYSWLYPRLVRGRPARWVVVLGSGLIDGDRVPPLLAGRIAAGQAAYAERGAQLIIMSGGQGPDETVPEARAMAAWATAQGADSDRLAVEDRSRTTEENLRFTAELIARTPSAVPEVPVTTRSPGARIPHWLDRLLGGPITPDPAEGLIVTSDYHVLRAAILARRLGVPAQASGARTARYYWPSAMLREFVALLVGRRRLHLVLGALLALPLPVLLLILGQFQ